MHLDELINGLVFHPELKEKRLMSIEQLCGKIIIVPDVAYFVMAIETL